MRERAWVLLKSGRRLDLLDPDPDSWTDEDIAIGLARTYRWGGHSRWSLPLSVAQHSLTVLAIRVAHSDRPLTQREKLRELAHDLDEGLLGYDAITPLKPHLGEGYARLVARLQGAIRDRYVLPPWNAPDYQAHKRADRLAAASEAYHVVGWSAEDIRESLGIATDPLAEDPVRPPKGMSPWEPWPPELAARLYLREMEVMQHGMNVPQETSPQGIRGDRNTPPTRDRCAALATEARREKRTSRAGRDCHARIS